MHTQLALKDILAKNRSVNFEGKLLRDFIQVMSAVDLNIRGAKYNRVTNSFRQDKYNLLWLGYLNGRGYIFTPVCDNCKQVMWSYGATFTPLLEDYHLCTPVCATEFTLNKDNLELIRIILSPYDSDSCMKLLCEAITTLDPNSTILLTKTERYAKAKEVYYSIFTNEKESN